MRGAMLCLSADLTTHAVYNFSPCTRIYTHPFFEATPPGAAPGPPVKPGPVFVASGGVISSARDPGLSNGRVHQPGAPTKGLPASSSCQGGPGLVLRKRVLPRVLVTGDANTRGRAAFRVEALAPLA